eukprot:TRINITY_DN85136_c0_g1_i1.p1 TRINITY_DN85136_c0_g1~~TRINITY_DN85136_c0_g1_i1.p1  ORF type:complete len:559 (-),score=58.07 TRINITY_DN85136_c0_g1_i1:11-1687(-)
MGSSRCAFLLRTLLMIRVPVVVSKGLHSELGPIVQTQSGKVLGIVDNGVNVFRGIPFAAPPTKEFRWKPPQPASSWAGVRNATTFRSACHQKEGNTNTGGEDCLYLNVFAPPSPVGGLPCLVWVHGGGYEIGSASGFDATEVVKFYMESGQPAVVITTNYRLNIFGFLGSDALRSRDEAHGSTGNYGIQDQRAAFQWVQDNINEFGGDPQRVMIYGESAGAGSMTNHLSMPRSFGLFSSIALESGSFASWTAQPLAYSEMVYKQVLIRADCQELSCLQGLTPEQLQAALDTIDVGRCCSHTEGHAFIPWAPTVDGVELDAHPWQLLRDGKVNKVPVLHGTNTDEGAMFTSLLKNATKAEYVERFVAWYGPLMGKSSASRAALDIYINGEEHPNASGVAEAWWAAERSLTDQMFACPARDTSQYLSEQGVDVYQYLFSDHFTWGHPAVTHTAEIPFVFMNSKALMTEENRKLAREMASYWYRHAATGNPNAESHSDPMGTTWWPRFNQSKGQYLQLDVQEAGGIRAISVPFRAVSCSFMGEWLEREMGGAQPDEALVIV